MFHSLSVVIFSCSKASFLSVFKFLLQHMRFPFFPVVWFKRDSLKQAVFSFCFTTDSAFLTGCSSKILRIGFFSVFTDSIFATAITDSHIVSSNFRVPPKFEMRCRTLDPHYTLENPPNFGQQKRRPFSGSPACFFYIGKLAVTTNVLASGVDAEIFPLCSSAIACAIERPMPWPPVSELREQSIR